MSGNPGVVPTIDFEGGIVSIGNVGIDVGARNNERL